MNKEEIIKKWLNNDLSEAERKDFEKTEEYKSLERLSSALQAFKAPEYNLEAESQKVNEKIGESDTKVISISWLNPLLKVAAVLVFGLAGYFFLFQSSSEVIQTIASEKSEVYLPDSSLVILNASSKLSYNKNQWNKHRRVKLEGEAFFDVSKGSNFQVRINSGIVEVLGTEFNIRERSGLFEVNCYEGLVGVTAGGVSVELPMGKTFRMVNGTIIDSDDLKIQNEEPSWLNDISSFSSIPYKYVIEEFELQYDLNIEVEDIDENKLFTGSFVHNNKELALQAITKPLNLSFQTIKNGNVRLKGGEN